jgi:hypothetical protein
MALRRKHALVESSEAEWAARCTSNVRNLVSDCVPSRVLPMKMTRPSNSVRHRRLQNCGEQTVPSNAA